jgi:hypothetical protein
VREGELIAKLFLTTLLLGFSGWQQKWGEAQGERRLIGSELREAVTGCPQWTSFIKLTGMYEFRVLCTYLSLCCVTRQVISHTSTIFSKTPSCEILLRMEDEKV